MGSNVRQAPARQKCAASRVRDVGLQIRLVWARRAGSRRIAYHAGRRGAPPRTRAPARAPGYASRAPRSRRRGAPLAPTGWETRRVRLRSPRSAPCPNHALARPANPALSASTNSSPVPSVCRSRVRRGFPRTSINGSCVKQKLCRGLTPEFTCKRINRMRRRSRRYRRSLDKCNDPVCRAAAPSQPDSLSRQ